MLPDGRTRFRLWAPSARSVALKLGRAESARALDMPRDADGWCELVVDAPAGTRYAYRVDDALDVPDPASRYNPDDVHAASEVVDPLTFEWTDGGWRGRSWRDAVIYELHVGTFTPEGTFSGVESRLDYLAALGVTAIELMPVADFPGRRNWGYDGVLQYAPDASYGKPDDLKRLVAAAHRRGLMMMLDVVYNHFGPDGNYLHTYAAPFFTERHHTPWGAAIDFGGRDSRAVRDFFIHNALYWLEEFHFDGLRFDAVHAIVDETNPHILTELAEAVRVGPARSREIHLVLENDDNEARHLEHRNDAPRWYNAQWVDDEHHAFHALLTAERDGYYADYADAPARHLGRALSEGFAYQGELSGYRDGKPRGEPSAHLPFGAFVTYLQNHDQTGNRALGERLTTLTSPQKLRAAAAAWLLAPQPPMLFMGEELGATCPFLFFCDFGPELAKAVREGREREFARFSRFASTGALRVPDPNDPATYARSKLDWSALERPEHAAWLAFYKQLLARRREQIVPRLAGGSRAGGRYSVVGPGALVVWWTLPSGAALELRLNLSGENARGPGRPRGNLVHSEPPGAADAFNGGELPSASAAIYLQA